MAKGILIENIERRAEFLGKVDNIAATYAEVTLLAYFSGEREKS
jgi:hypothetical protein